jgi:hypothetical protein
VQVLVPVVWGALAHHRLVAIDPSSDGDGSAAGLVMNLLLMRDGCPPAAIGNAGRRQYLRALVRADTGDERPLVNSVGRAAERSLTLYLEACTPQTVRPAPEDEWIPLCEAAQDTPQSLEYLSLLVHKVRLEAVKLGRSWCTSWRAVAAYRAYVRETRGE